MVSVLLSVALSYTGTMKSFFSWLMQDLLTLSYSGVAVTKYKVDPFYHKNHLPCNHGEQLN